MWNNECSILVSRHYSSKIRRPENMNNFIQIEFVVCTSVCRIILKVAFKFLLFRGNYISFSLSSEFKLYRVSL